VLYVIRAIVSSTYWREGEEGGVFGRNSSVFQSKYREIDRKDYRSDLKHSSHRDMGYLIY